MPESRALLVLKPGYIGDAVLSLPLLDCLLAAFGSVTVCAAEALRPIFRDRPCEWLAPPDRHLAGVLRWRRLVLRESFQAAFLANRSFRSALQVRLAGVPVRVGHRTEARGALLTVAVPYSSARSEVECLLDLARSIGLEVRASRPRISRPESPDGKVRLQPGARHPWKRPPWHVLGQALSALRIADHDVELVGGPAEVESCRAFARQFCQGAAIVAGRTDLDGILRRLSSSRAFIAGDTGLVHLAAAMGVPTLAFLSPRLAPKWGWHEPRNVTLTTEASADEAVEALSRALYADQ
ncbi:MAG: glycosyltransferase family 9 protein [Fimbriimonadaceae bacterium]